MGDIKDIETRVDLLRSSQRLGTVKRKRIHRVVRWVSGGSTLFVALKVLFIFGVVAVLIGSMGTFLLVQEQDVNLEGVGAPAIFFDGVQMVEPTYNVPNDIFTDDKLVAGETEIFTHTVSSPIGDGDWSLYWDVSENMNWFNDPDAEFYGYYFDTTDEEGIPINYMDVMHGETKEINFYHELDPHFQATSNPAPFSLELHIIPYCDAPDGVDDDFQITRLGAVNVNVLDNDITHFIEPGFTILSVTSFNHDDITVSVSPDAQYLIVDWQWHTPLTVSCEYTFEDMSPFHKQGTAILTVWCL